MTPTALSLKHLRAAGYVADIVERHMRIPGGRSFKRDLFGSWDIVAVKPGEVAFVQTTSGSNVSARLRKIADNPTTPRCREANVRLLIHGWSKPTKTRRTWRLREEDVS
jgi:hypothetical protein